MSTYDANPSDNGRGSEAWSRSWTHVRIDRPSAGYCRLTFDHPPINTITTTTIAELAELAGLIEQDPDLNVSFSTAPTAISTSPTTPKRTTPAGPRHCQPVRP